MADTTHFGWTKPTVDADEDAWGDILNTALDDIDASLKTVEDGVGLVKLSGASVSAVATLDIPLSALYSKFKLHIINLVPASSAYLCGRLSFDGGSTYRSTANDYVYAAHGVDSIAGAGAVGSSTANAVLFGGTNATGTTANRNNGIEVDLRTPAAGGAQAVMEYIHSHVDSANDVVWRGRARCTASTDRATHIRLFYSAGNIASASWALFGVKGL